MALDSAGLKTALKALLDGTTPLSTAAAAGTAWADAIGTYALTGKAGAVTATEGPGTRAAFASAFAAGVSVPGEAADAAAAITAALGVYWVAMLFAGQIAPTNPTVGAADLQTALANIFSNVGGTHDAKATSIRDAIHDYTQNVTVTFAGPAIVTIS